MRRNKQPSGRSVLRRWSALVLAAAALLSMAVPAKAATSDDTRLVRVEMNLERMTVRVNQERTLTVAIGVYDAARTSNSLRWTYGDDDWPVTWTTSNPEVAWVDGEGVVTGVSPGTAVITAEVDSGRSYNSIHSQTQAASCTVTVPGTVIKSDAYRTDSAGAEAEANSGERLDAAAIQTAVREALDASPAGTLSLTWRDKTVTTTAALRGAAYTAQSGGASARLRFQTMDAAGGAVQGQMTIRPELTSPEDYEIRVGVYIDEAHTAATLAKANARFGEGCAAVRLAHSGSLGMAVEIAAKVNLNGHSADALTLYYLDNDTGSFTPLETQSCRVDENGYLHFTATRGGDIVIVFDR